MLALGDISAARLLYARAAARGSAKAATTLGKTYDPAFLASIQVSGLAPNRGVVIALLLLRSLFAQMDVPARQAFVMAIVPAAERAFAQGTSNPFDVSCVVRGLDAVGLAVRDRRYRVAATLARAWFDGRNAASEPVFDRVRGLVHDGIDDGRVSANSGAEANIEAGLALVAS